MGLRSCLVLSTAMAAGLTVSMSVAATAPKPPVAVEAPHELKAMGETRNDPYFWMRGKDKSEVLKHLKAENAYFEAVMKPQAKLQKKLLSEMKSHIQEDETTFPVRRDGFLYYAKLLKGNEFPIYYRRRMGDGAAEQLMLDVNKLNPGGAYTRVGAMAVSDDGKILAYALDTKGDRIFKIHYKDLATGQMMADTVENTTGDIVWAADNKTIFYGAYEPVTLRQRYIHRHVLGESKDSLVYDEKDEKYNVDLRRGLSKKYIYLESRSKMSSEVRYLLAAEPAKEPKLFQARQPEFEYSVYDGGDRFYIRTNWQAVNFRVMETALDRTGRDAWKEVVPHRADTFIEEIIAFKGHLVIEEVQGGLNRIKVVSCADGKSESIAFKDPAYSAWLDHNAEYDAGVLNFVYTSLTTPSAVYEYDFTSKKQEQRWQRQVPGGFKSENYESLRLFATAGDGTKIPISLVYRKDRRTPGRAQPLLQYGYGSYGYSMHPSFDSNRLSLLDRGFIFAIAHVRGGQEMGREWYLNGKFLKKKNTFTDFIACSEFLVKEGYTSPQKLFAEGRSAGGLLMGAVVNMRPDLYNGVIAGVPFVDVLTTMLDASLPLTTEEYEEWGNPNDKAYYEYMKSYSPYDNIKAQEYPALFVSTGLNDTQVSYWEPAKWVARLRKTKTDSKPILFKIEMGAGHGGKNGRFAALELHAAEQAFMLSRVGIVK